MEILLFIIFFLIPCAAVFWVSYKGYVNIKKDKRENENKTSKGRK